MKNRKLRILHIVCYFYAGGCERLLTDVLRHSDRNLYEHMVISLSNKKERISTVEKTLGIPYFAFDMKKKPQRLPALIRDCKPDLIQTWLAYSNVTGGLAARVFNLPVIWGIHTCMAPEQFPSEIPLIEKQRQYSHALAQRIICCSKPVYDLYLRLGFDPKLLLTITNGTDTKQFAHNPEGRKRIRASLGVPDHAPLIGMAAAYVPLIKGHYQFLHAAAHLLRTSYPDAHFLLCGNGADEKNLILKELRARLGLKGRVHLLGIRDDMADIYSAMDIHTLNSKSESFGLATSEAMACETLCVVTNVAVGKELLKGVGEVIPVVAHPGELIGAWQTLLSLTPAEKARREIKGRNRIRNDYSIHATVKHYDDLCKTSVETWRKRRSA